MQVLLTMDGGILVGWVLWEGGRSGGMKRGAGEAASVHWGEGRTRKLLVERSNNRILTSNNLYLKQKNQKERDKKVENTTF